MMPITSRAPGFCRGGLTVMFCPFSWLTKAPGELRDGQLAGQRVHALDRGERRREVLVEQGEGRERHRELLVVGVDRHPPRVGLALQEGAGLRVARDPPGQGLRGVGGVTEQQDVVARRAARPVDTRVELEELGVPEDVERVVMTAGSAPERYDAVTSLATSRALSFIEVTGRPLASSTWNATTSP